MLEEAERAHQTVTDIISNLRKEREEIASELKEVEKAAFKAFCKKAKVKSIAEYEQQLYKAGEQNAFAGSVEGSTDLDTLI